MGQQREEFRKNENYQKIIAMSKVYEISVYQRLTCEGLDSHIDQRCYHTEQVLSKLCQVFPVVLVLY